MSVVVNEFDLVPAAAPTGQESAPAASPAPRRVSPSTIADVDRAQRVRVERCRRLEAY